MYGITDLSMSVKEKENKTMAKNNVAATVKTNNTEVNKEKRMNKTEKRLSKFARRREEGKAYTYKPNPYEKGTREYRLESEKRTAKNVSKDFICKNDKHYGKAGQPVKG